MAANKFRKTYFREMPSEFIISLPVRYNIVRARDTAGIQSRGFMSVAQLDASLRATMAEITASDGNAPGQVARLRRELLARIIQFRTADGSGALHYEADVTTYYRPDTPRVWKCDELRTAVEPNALFSKRLL